MQIELRAMERRAPKVIKHLKVVEHHACGSQLVLWVLLVQPWRRNRVALMYEFRHRSGLMVLISDACSGFGSRFMGPCLALSAMLLLLDFAVIETMAV